MGAERAANFFLKIVRSLVTPSSLVISSATPALQLIVGSAREKVCASHGVDRIGSLEMLILSEFEAFEPRLRACLHASSSSQAKYSGAYLRSVHGRVSSVKV